MFDARIFTSELDTFKKALHDHEAVFKGEYVISDSIFSTKDPNSGIDKIFLRLRHISKNLWNEKPFIVSVKQTKLQEVGKQSIILGKKDFETLNEAREFIEENYADTFEFLYNFDRVGWQYDLGNNQIDLEDIEGRYSLEFKSPTEAGLKQLLKLFNVKDKDVISGPSVVAIKDLLGR
jgi:hypothetical protein